jgi:cysteinyl-tRNA synthetase
VTLHLTTQGPPRIGHTRNWVSFDILRPWPPRSGHELTFVRNVTDIDASDAVRDQLAEAGVLVEDIPSALDR